MTLVLVYFVGEFWYYTLPVAALIALFGLVLKNRGRTVLWSLAGVLAIYVAGFWAVKGVHAAHSHAEQMKAEAHAAVLHQVQTEARVVNGFLLPVGATVQWLNDGKTDISTADLPGPTPEFGVLLRGHVEAFSREYSHDWIATLAAPGTIDRWPCAAGKVVLSREGHLQQCTLGSPRQMEGYVVPAGTSLDRMYDFEDDGVWGLQAPAGGHISLPRYDVDVPSGYKLELYRNEAIREIEPDIDAMGGDEHTWPSLKIHGLAVHFFIEMKSPDDSGNAPVDAKQRPAWARIDLYGQPTCAGHKLPDEQVRLYFPELTVQDEDPSGDGVGPKYPVAACTAPSRP